MTSPLSGLSDSPPDHADVLPASLSNAIDFDLDLDWGADDHEAVKTRLLRGFDRLVSRTSDSKLAHKIIDERRKIASFLERNVTTKVRARLRQPVAIKLIDKITFVLGVLYLIATVAVMCLAPQRMSDWYLATVLPLCALRFYLYHAQKFHYFLLDFCYFANSLLVFFLCVYPTSPYLFHLTFCLSNGPLLLAMLVWRNSLVFHDIDKLTSLIIHVLPAVTTYCIRWYPWQDGPQLLIVPLTMRLTMSGPLLVYGIWQLSYLVKTVVVDKEKLRDQQLVTSLSWVSTKRGTVMNSLIRKFPQNWALGVFIAMQLLYTVLTLLPLPSYFDNATVHLGMIIAMFTMTLWNGANYYFEVFAKHYVDELPKPSPRVSPAQASSSPRKGSTTSQ